MIECEVDRRWHEYATQRCATGSAARRTSDSSPSKISRRTSRPTTKKKITIRMSLIQKWTERVKACSPNPKEMGACSRCS